MRKIPPPELLSATGVAIDTRPIPVKTFIPKGEYLGVHVWRDDQRTDSGIILPDAELDWYPVRALVIAAGPDAKDVKEGDTVLFSQRLLATVVRHRGNELLLVPSTKMIGVELPADAVS